MISDFGSTSDGRKVTMVTLTSGDLECTVIDLGCALRSVTLTDGRGKRRDVLLGYDDPESYLRNGGHFGGVIGRYANRIKGGICPIGDDTFRLTVNRGNNHMHGGNDPYDKRIWYIVSHTDEEVVFELDDADGSDGYPGNLHATCTYTLDGDTLRAEYTAVSDRDTVCNIINHSYFNLGDSSDICDHEVRLYADRYTPLDAESIPVGTLEPVEGTAMDLRDWRSLEDMEGYDCNWRVNGPSGSMRLAGSVRCASSGLQLDVSTNMPGIQFYTGNGIREGTRGKNGAVYGRWSGLCLETQHFPDAPNHPNFPSAVLRKGETYIHITDYAFSRL